MNYLNYFYYDILRVIVDKNNNLGMEYELLEDACPSSVSYDSKTYYSDLLNEGFIVEFYQNEVKMVRLTIKGLLLLDQIERS